MSAWKLEVQHWKILYAMVTLDTAAVDLEKVRRCEKYGWGRKYAEQCTKQRAQLCEAIGIAEERVPLEVLIEFWQRHERYARLPLEYPEACASGCAAMESGGGVSRNLRSCSTAGDGHCVCTGRWV